ncbi:Rv3654c family TadE-like protein [Glycomyces tenuis]|uniref:Rv3654c family TadE-like protein n=1 Tax=Glycomyces tenuis TaxID=58116 RepID=UPI0009DBA142|nr:Rv3654c family TadE-like protein [Glycomyces tenuis]
MTGRLDLTGSARHRPRPPVPGHRGAKRDPNTRSRAPTEGRSSDRERAPNHGPGSEHERERGSDHNRGSVHERGSATVLAVGVVATLVVLAGAFAALGQATAARHRAQGAADAAALAGAARVLLGDGAACEAAAELAAEGGADIERCVVEDLEVTVTVTVEPSGIPAAFGPARAVSRAGPVMTH